VLGAEPLSRIDDSDWRRRCDIRGESIPVLKSDGTIVDSFDKPGSYSSDYTVMPDGINKCRCGGPWGKSRIGPKGRWNGLFVGRLEYGALPNNSNSYYGSNDVACAAGPYNSRGLNVSGFDVPCQWVVVYI